MKPYFAHFGCTIGALMVLSLSGCQSLAASINSNAAVNSKTKGTPSTISANPTLQQMDTIDRTGRIAYIESIRDETGTHSMLYSIHPDGSDKHKYAEVDGGNIYSLAWSDDGRYLTYSVQRARSYPVIYLYDSVTEHTIPLITDRGMNLSAQLSADNSTLIYTSSDEEGTRIYEYDMATGTRSPAIKTEWPNSLQPKYLPNGDIVFVSDKGVSNRPRIYRYDRDARTVTNIDTDGYSVSPSISRDGQLMSYLSGRNAAIMNLTTGTNIANFGDNGLDETAKLSPSANYVVYPMRTPKAALSDSLQGAPNDVTRRAVTSQIVIRPLYGEGEAFTLVSAQGTLRDPVWGVLPSAQTYGEEK